MLNYFIAQSFTVRLLKAPPFLHPFFHLPTPTPDFLSPLHSLPGQQVSLSDPKSTQKISLYSVSHCSARSITFTANLC